jgi:phosphoribosyl 1,2-cyclic phosphodiesterase
MNECILAFMAVSVSVLASGSRGNSAVIETPGARILVDAGLSGRETFKRLKSIGLDPRSLSAILISHEHSDHVGGLATLAKKLRLPVFMTGATHQAWARSLRDEAGELPKLEKLEVFSAGRSFHICDITITAFTIPHDAADPVGFTFHAEGTKIAIATDLGYMPASVCDHLRKCDVLVVESNHDLEMLRGGPYPWSVKQRVMSRVGHLSNESLARFFAEEYDKSASYIVLAHLSEHNNHPEVARKAAEDALGPQRSLLENRIMLAAQDAPTECIRL